MAHATNHSFFMDLSMSVKSWGQKALQRYSSRKTVQVLEGLSDRQLDDIGLCRGDIAVYARKLNGL